MMYKGDMALPNLLCLLSLSLLSTLFCLLVGESNPLIFGLHVEIRLGFPNRLPQVSLADDMIAIKDASRPVTAHRHGHAFWHTGPHHVPD